MEIEYSKLKSDEAEQIEKIEKECFINPWTAENIIESLNFGTVFLVAKWGSNVIGYVGMQQAAPQGYITNVAVLNEFRRKGIAYNLLRHLEWGARENEINEISLEVRKSNISAQDLYKKCGYKFMGERKNFYRNPKEDAFIMTLKIQGEKNDNFKY